MKTNHVLLTFFLLASTSMLETKAIQHIRWGSSGDPLNGLTITWRNAGVKDSIKWGYSSYYEQGTHAGIKRNGYADYFFKYVFPSVNPSSVILYRLFDSNTNSWGPQKTYTTAPASSTTNFSFLALGDSRSGMTVWNQVSTLADSKKTDFAIFTGDIVNDGNSNSNWDSWFNNGTQFIQNNIVYHSLGNHDASSVPKYQNTFDLPQTNSSSLYYSFTYGNAVFICLNSESPSSSTQYNWLVSTLQANQNKTWKIVFFHRPFYTIGSHAGEMNSYFSTWWKAFDDYGVDLVVNGHDHMYERTKPINRNVSTTSAVSSYGSGPADGRCQIVCGGAGAPLYSGSPSWFIQKYQSKSHFCKIDISGSVLCDTTFDNNGAIIETFCINKTSTGITDQEQKFNPITIVPNPSEGEFSLKYNSESEGSAQISIYDINGKQLLSETVEKYRNDLEYRYDMSQYPAGVYSIQIMMGKQKDNALIILK